MPISLTSARRTGLPSISLAYSLIPEAPQHGSEGNDGPDEAVGQTDTGEAAHNHSPIRVVCYLLQGDCNTSENHESEHEGEPLRELTEVHVLPVCASHNGQRYDRLAIDRSSSRGIVRDSWCRTAAPGAVCRHVVTLSRLEETNTTWPTTKVKPRELVYEPSVATVFASTKLTT